MFAHDYTARDAFRALHSDFRRLRRSGRGPGHWDRELGLSAATDGAARRMGVPVLGDWGWARAIVCDALSSAADWRRTTIRQGEKRWLVPARSQLEHARDYRLRNTSPLP